MPSDVAEKMRALERENHELRQANEILRKASAYFARADLDRVNRRFFAPAPNMLWLSDFTSVATWQGFVLRH
ncbi:transposase InsO family protein [Agrobacterium tumefaciens]|uniref:Transposase InsO family protein n=1 Tax=Agrobacterium tumefaciens TaxID=358 RepID=A0AAW8M1T6_AGRTU|nr:transposase InsO family protein [Agrobacterium tumefaciens]MDR6705287.1 transposase InsO family protein [Agrobacterium tumefaciens]